MRWLVALLLLPIAAASGGHHGEHADPDELIADWLPLRQVTTPEEAAGNVITSGYPLPGDPSERFAEFVVREDLTAAGMLDGAYRALRFLHITDMQLVDDDAPPPSRIWPLDPAFAATITGGAQRPQDEYADEILHSMVSVMNIHHALDPFAFAIHTGDNIDNALENEMMRYIDLVDGTHTTTGPFSGLACEPDGQSSSIDDHANDVVTACTSLPSHVAEANAGGPDTLPWFSLNGNHDSLVYGNAPPNPAYNALLTPFGRHFLVGDEYVAMHFDDLDICAGGSAADDFGHGYGWADETRRCDDDVENDAYYGFDHGAIRMIALDTVNDEFYQGNQNLDALPTQSQTQFDAFSGLSEGGMDVAQFAWLEAELQAASGRPVVIFAHHAPATFYDHHAVVNTPCVSPICMSEIFHEAGQIDSVVLESLLDQHPNIIGFFGGHTHFHRVLAEDSGAAAYWSIETSGLLDLPQESRIVELWITPEGKAFWALDPIGHLFQLGKELAATDPDEDAERNQGTELDRRTLLWFDLPAGSVPAAAAQPAGASMEPATLLLDIVVQNLVDEPHVNLSVTAFDAGNGTPVAGLTVLVNGTSLFGHGDGNYNGIIDLEAGENRLVIRALDPAGRYSAAEAEAHVLYTPPTNGSPGAFLPTALALCALALLRRR